MDHDTKVKTNTENLNREKVVDSVLDYDAKVKNVTKSHDHQVMITTESSDTKKTYDLQDRNVITVSSDQHSPPQPPTPQQLQ